MSVIETPNGYTLDNSGKRVVFDPITRIEGHMRIEVNVDENNQDSIMDDAAKQTAAIQKSL